MSTPSAVKHRSYAVSAEAGHTLLAIEVQNNDVELALRLLKRQTQKSGLIRELRRRRQYEKPSERRRRQKRDGIRNTRKRERLARG